MHEILPFSPVKISHGVSTVFEMSVENRWDQRQVLSGVPGQDDSGWRRVVSLHELVSIPDSTEELCDSCFSWCKRLSRVTFGESSSLKLIGKKAFDGSGMVEIHIPNSVEQLSEECFAYCEGLSRVTFGESSSLKLIGNGVFRESGVVEIHIPDGVEELCEECFFSCKRLSRVTLGEYSSFKLITKGYSVEVTCVRFIFWFA